MLLIGVGTLVSWACTGCGYTSARPFREDIRTVHVEMFQSQEFRRELEFRLTESLIKRVEMDTRYRVAPQKTADALLSGEILEVQNRTLGDSFDSDQPREMGSTVVVRFAFKDLRSGEILVDRPRFVYQTSYIPPVGRISRRARPGDGRAGGSHRRGDGIPLVGPLSFRHHLRMVWHGLPARSFHRQDVGATRGRMASRVSEMDSSPGGRRCRPTFTLAAFMSTELGER